MTFNQLQQFFAQREEQIRLNIEAAKQIDVEDQAIIFDMWDKGADADIIADYVDLAPDVIEEFIRLSESA